MSLLEQIRRPVEAQMSLYEARLRQLLTDTLPAMSPITVEIFARRGKAIRPMIVMLAAGLFPDCEDKRERSVVGALMSEMVHTSSLIHDDVIDEAYVRRSAPSINALWGNHLAVLAGDYILATAFDEGLNSGHIDILKCINNTLMQVCEGEMLQSSQSSSLKMTREIYLDIILKKTGLLISAAASLGAMAAHAPQEQVDKLADYGRNLGIAFQMRDDVLDYAPQSQTGKPACGDLRERKINMPMLALLEGSSEERRRELLKKLSSIRRCPENVEYLHKAVVEAGAIEATGRIMQGYLDAARQAISDFPESESKTALYDLCYYIATRSK